MVGNEHLVAEKLYFVALKFYVVLHTWEVEDTCEVEGVVYVEVDPEEGLFEGLRVELVVEGDVVFILELGGLLRPSRVNIVDLVVLVGVYIGTVLPLLLLAEDDGDGEELAVLVQ